MSDYQFGGVLALTDIDDELDHGSPATFQNYSFQRLEQTTLFEEAIASGIEKAATSHELVDVAKLFVPEFIGDRLESIFSPPDREEEAGILQPELLLGSFKEYLYFCLRMRGLLDYRFMPGRTHAGELGIQFLDDRLGDLSIRFRCDGSALLAVISDNGVSSGNCLAKILCTSLDHFNITRWM